MVPARRIIWETYPPGYRALGFGFGFDDEEGPQFIIGFWFGGLTFYWKAQS